MKRTAFLLVLFLLLIPGCAFVNLSLVSGTKPLEEKLLEGKGKPKILIVDLDGTISLKEETDYLKIRKKPSKVAFFREAMRKAEADSDIAGVIVKINSPGGSVTASDTIYHEIMNFRQDRKIPVEAYILGLGASGGYYVASACDHIIAAPTSITGSIGVIAMKLNAEGLFSKIGVADETYKSGPKKDFWSPFHPSTPEEREMLQGIIDKLHSRFVEVVYANRRGLLTEQEVKSLADGRILLADEALEAGLIDKIAYLDQEIRSMKESLHIDQARVVTYDRPETFKSNIYSEIPAPGTQILNLISINAGELPLSPGVRFLYLWNP